MQVTTTDPRKGQLTQGVAGESLVIYDLLRQGVPAFLSMAGLRYDVVADLEGKLVRIQVKATSQTPVYDFHVTDRNHKPYKEDEFDLVALVSLDCHLVGYLPAFKVLKRKRFRFEETTLANLPFREAYERQRSNHPAPGNTSERLREKVSKRRRAKKGSFGGASKGNTGCNRSDRVLLQRAS